MVWNTTQTSLYAAVDRHNSAVSRDSEKPPDIIKPDIIPPPKACPETNASKPNIARNPLEKLFSDKDTLLLAALIIILLHENADMKLIAALAFVLLAN